MKKSFITSGPEARHLFCAFKIISQRIDINITDVVRVLCGFY